MEVAINNITCNVSFNLDVLIDGKPKSVKIDYPLKKHNKILLKNDTLVAQLYHSFVVNYQDGRDVIDNYSVEPNSVVANLKGKTLTIKGGA